VLLLPGGDQDDAEHREADAGGLETAPASWLQSATATGESRRLVVPAMKSLDP
jgi:hypothetical protein